LRLCQGCHEGKVVGLIHKVKDKNKENVTIAAPSGSIFGNLVPQIKQANHFV
jgi:hypothetical protein